MFYLCIALCIGGYYALFLEKCQELFPCFYKKFLFFLVEDLNLFFLYGIVLFKIEKGFFRYEKQKHNFESAKKELFELAVKLGGTLSGEHGIGCQKANFLPIALDKATLQLMSQIKKVFDPNYILNPEKML